MLLLFYKNAVPGDQLRLMLVYNKIKSFDYFKKSSYRKTLNYRYIFPKFKAHCLSKKYRIVLKTFFVLITQEVLSDEGHCQSETSVSRASAGNITISITFFNLGII